MYLKLCLMTVLFVVSNFATGAVQTSEQKGSVDNGYIGKKACAQCHLKQLLQWSGSHHDRAMQLATDDSVLGDFNQAELAHNGVTSTFFKKDNRFIVKTSGADGKLHDFIIEYTFGFYPLQQYLIDMPGGRLQVLNIAWDSRPVEQGGQRWFPVQLNQNNYSHWTHPDFNWNSNCAACHTTNLQKNYDPDTHSYNTEWTEMDVSCEACHGPGQMHQQWALTITDPNQQSLTAPPESLNLMGAGQTGLWPTDPVKGVYYRDNSGNNISEIETCAQCHSQREQIKSGKPGEPLMDNFRLGLLEPKYYHANGQVRGEAYVYGSYLQSSKYQAGVKCSDCHEPHIGELRLPGDRVCNQCHTSESYRTERHHHHPAQAKTSCLDCHMPVNTFMQIDQRHDHSFIIPEPANSGRLNAPSVCHQCHQDKNAQWTADTLAQWGVNKVKEKAFAPILDAQRKQLSDANKKAIVLLQDTQLPVIARATILSQLSNQVDEQALSVMEQQLKSDEAMIRVAALIALEGWLKSGSLSFESIAQLAFPLLSDPVRLVRMEAARLLAPLDESQLGDGDKIAIQKARQEYIDSLEFNAERPESQLSLAEYYLARNDLLNAEKVYRNVLDVHKSYTQGWVQMAQFYSEMDRDADAIETLKRGLEVVPEVNSADLYHALGLAQVRTKDLSEAIVSLATAAQLASDNPHYSYVYGIALNSYQRPEEALEQLQKAHEAHPDNREILTALASINQDMKQYQVALKYANQLLSLDSEDQQTQETITKLKTLLQ